MLFFLLNQFHKKAIDHVLSNAMLRYFPFQPHERVDINLKVWENIVSDFKGDKAYNFIKDTFSSSIIISTVSEKKKALCRKYVKWIKQQLKLRIIVLRIKTKIFNINGHKQSIQSDLKVHPSIHRNNTHMQWLYHKMLLFINEK